MCVYICMYVCMYVCMCASNCICMFMHINKSNILYYDKMFHCDGFFLFLINVSIKKEIINNTL